MKNKISDYLMILMFIGELFILPICVIVACFRSEHFITGTILTALYCATFLTSFFHEHENKKQDNIQSPTIHTKENNKEQKTNDFSALIPLLILLPIFLFAIIGKVDYS